MSAASPPLRVLEVVGNAITGGMERYGDNLLVHLPAWIEADVVAPFASPVTERWAEEGRRVHIAPVDDEAQLMHSVERIVELARRTGAGLLHSHLANANAVCALASAVSGVPAIATIHGRQLTLRDVEALRLGLAHALVVCDAALSQGLLLGLAHARLSFIPNGVDTTRYVPRPARPAAAATVIGFVGRLAPEKEPVDFVRVAAEVAARCDHAMFRMIGDGPQRAAVEREVARCGLAGRLTLTGVVDDMARAYHELDILVSTSSSEGAPLALLEAMACGIPVVATGVGGVPEIVVNGLTGRMLPARAIHALARAVLDLAGDPAQRAVMGAAARRRVQRRYDVRRNAECVAALMGRAAAYPVPDGELRGVVRLARDVRIA